MVWLWPLLFGIGCALAMRLADDTAARAMATHLVVMWALANAAWASNMLWVLPVLDLALGVVALQIWWTTRAKWVALIVNAVAIRLALHVFDSLTGHVFFISYAHALNATFAWMVFAVALSGGGHDRYSVLRRIRRLRGALSPAAPGRLTGGR